MCVLVLWTVDSSCFVPTEVSRFETPPYMCHLLYQRCCIVTSLCPYQRAARVYGRLSECFGSSVIAADERCYSNDTAFWWPRHTPQWCACSGWWSSCCDDAMTLVQSRQSHDVAFFNACLRMSFNTCIYFLSCCVRCDFVAHIYFWYNLGSFVLDSKVSWHCRLVHHV